ncbi:FAD-dependent oxidoreductase [Trinickia sp. LjRoot230]|uniref:protoporphyrinogen/coproporphyrinogen oxidase n=1 Tax=Trinickia sp. LjRoot230 TaxID=3342288 RepID=UPI003ECD8A9A
MAGRVVVVGAGIAGLTAAYRLKMAGLDVTVLERTAQVGGRMSTHTRDGYRIDVGASLLPTSYKQMLALIEEAGLSEEIMTTSSLFGLLRDGEIHRFQAGKLRDMLAMPLSMRSKWVLSKAVVDCIRLGDKLDWYDLSRAIEVDDESAPEYAKRRLNQEILDYLVEPTCASMTLNTVEENSAASFLFFIRRVLATRGLFNSPSGVGFLARGLARHIGDVRLQACALAVEKSRGGVVVTWQQADGPAQTMEAAACVIALPARQAALLWPHWTPDQREFLDSVRYGKCINVSFALSRPPAEAACFVLIPRVEQSELGAIVLEHNKAPGRAPAGRGLITTYWRQTWSEPRAGLDDATISNQALDTLRHALPHLVTEVKWAHVQRWNPSIAVNFPGHLAALRRFVHSIDPHSPVQLAGDYFSGTTTNSSLCSGESAAARVLASGRLATCS